METRSGFRLAQATSKQYEKILWKYLGKKKNHESTFGLRYVTSRQLTGTSRGTNSSQETSQKPPEIPDTKECVSVTLYIYLKYRTERNRLVGMGRRMTVLTPRTHTCRYLKLDDRITKPCPYSHLSWSTPCWCGTSGLVLMTP